jgi:leucine dehydrogenase
MTYKAAIADVSLGGGKSVIILRERQHTSPELIRAMGRAINQVGGRYIAAEDIGTTEADISELRSVTPYVLGAPTELGGSGDPSLSTALGCFVGIEASVRYRNGSTKMSNVRVAVQGLGKVGYQLCRLLHQAGAQLIVTDIDSEKMSSAVISFGARAVAPDEIYDVEADVFSPCALGSVINDNTVQRFRVSVVAGGANNQLEDQASGDALHSRGILYAPDYVINAGGFIQLAMERLAKSRSQADGRVRGIARSLRNVFDLAEQMSVPVHLAADYLAQNRLDAAG